MPLDEDYEHARYDPGQVEEYFAAATQAALALAAFRAPYRGRSTPVNAWWGSFDLCVVMFSGAPADPPSEGFITRNSSDAQQVVVGWWPGDAHHRAAFYAYAYPVPPGFAGAACPRRPPAGTKAWGSTSWTGMTSGPPATRMPRPWTSSARPFTMATGRPDGAPNSVLPRKAGRPPYGDPATGRSGGRLACGRLCADGSSASAEPDVGPAAPRVLTAGVGHSRVDDKSRRSPAGAPRPGNDEVSLWPVIIRPRRLFEAPIPHIILGPATRNIR